MSAWVMPKMQILLSLLARLPLPVAHGLGVLVGWLRYAMARKYRRRMKTNLAYSVLASDPVHFRRLLHQSVSESGKTVTEAFLIWKRSQADVLSWVRQVVGWEHVTEAVLQGKGIIFLTPHLGCYEITSLYYGAYHPITVLYRPPRAAWMQPMMEAGRSRGNVTLAPASMAGVRQLMQALKRKEAIGILPDQVPAAGEGDWAPFFGRPAYTMTLASRLAGKSDAAVIMAFGERLPHGRGYRLHLKRLPQEALASPAALNASIENQIRAAPQQYLWSYDRYKRQRKLSGQPP